MNNLHLSTYTHTPSGSVCPFCTIFLKPLKIKKALMLDTAMCKNLLISCPA